VDSPRAKTGLMNRLMRNSSQQERGMGNLSRQRTPRRWQAQILLYLIQIQGQSI
jgi:hypothetical protein